MWCAQVRAASEALLLTGAAAGQPGVAPSPAAEPAAYLEALLQRLASLNREGYFDNPVDEEEAPGWGTDSPLCSSAPCSVACAAYVHLKQI